VRPEHHLRQRWWPWVLTAATLATWAVLASAQVVSHDGHRELTGPEWRRITADPSAHAGERVVVFGVVTQSGTRQGPVRARVDGLDRWAATSYATPAELRGPGPLPAAGDTFRAEVTVRGPAGGGLALDVHRVLLPERAG
jgi:hypothetical protein